VAVGVGERHGQGEQGGDAPEDAGDDLALRPAREQQVERADD
jgi:hypothetical protein